MSLNSNRVVITFFRFVYMDAKFILITYVIDVNECWWLELNKIKMDLYLIDELR